MGEFLYGNDSYILYYIFVHSANLQQMSNQANIPSLTSKDTVQQKSNSAQYSHKIPDNFNTITQHQDGCSYV